MKTAISIPDPLFREAEQLAQALGLSRSELYARAVRLYLQTHGYGGVTDALNALYAEEASAIDPALAAAQARVLPREAW